MYFLSEKTKRSIGAKAQFWKKHGELIEGNIVKDIRTLKFMLFTISVESKYIFVDADTKKEYVLRNIPENHINDHSQVRDISRYIKKEVSPIFPKIVIVLNYPLVIIPLLPALILATIQEKIGYLNRQWRLALYIQIGLLLFTHIVLWPYLFIMDIKI